MKIQFKGKVTEVFKLEEVGEKKTKKQTITVMRPGYVDGFGDKIGNDDYYEMSVFNEKITPAFLESLKGKKVNVTAFLSSFEYEEMINGQKTGLKRHGLNITLSEISEFTGNKPN